MSTASNLSQVDHGVVEFLHRERRHRVLELVAVALVFLFVCGVELLEELREHIRNALPVVLVGANVVLQVRYEDFLVFCFDGSRVFEARKSSKMLAMNSRGQWLKHCAVTFIEKQEYCKATYHSTKHSKELDYALNNRALF